MMNLYDKKYFIKQNIYLYKLFEKYNSNELSRIIKVDKSLLDKLYDDELKSEIVSYANALKISDYVHIPLDIMWEEIDFVSPIIPDKSFVDYTDDIIKGLEENIASKLRVHNLSNHFIKDVLDIVDTIVVESVNFGIKLKSKKEIDRFLEKKVK